MSEPALGPEMQKLVRRLRVRRNFPAVRSPGADAARLNAYLAVESDPVKLRARLADIRLAAAVILSPRLEVCEDLGLGIPVSVSRLDQVWVRELKLSGSVVLDDELALRVHARGPLRKEGR